MTSPEYALNFSPTSNRKPGLPWGWQSGVRATAWVSVGSMECLVVYAVGDASLIVLRIFQ